MSTVYLVLRLKGGILLNLNVKVFQDSKLENIQIEDKVTVLELKQEIYKKLNILKPDQFSLVYAGVNLQNEKVLTFYQVKADSVLQINKQSLDKELDLIISYEPDMISMDANKEARAKMSCGHVSTYILIII